MVVAEEGLFAQGAQPLVLASQTMNSQPRDDPAAGGGTSVGHTQRSFPKMHHFGLTAIPVPGIAAESLFFCLKYDNNKSFDLLRQHIHKEDHCLFSMANQAFTEVDQRQLLDAFAKVESEHMGLGTHEKYLRLAHDLADRYGVGRAAPAAVPGHACACGH